MLIYSMGGKPESLISQATVRDDVVSKLRTQIRHREI